MQDHVKTTPEDPLFSVEVALPAYQGPGASPKLASPGAAPHLDNPIRAAMPFKVNEHPMSGDRETPFELAMEKGTPQLGDSLGLSRPTAGVGAPA